MTFEQIVAKLEELRDSVLRDSVHSAVCRLRKAKRIERLVVSPGNRKFYVAIGTGRKAVDAIGGKLLYETIRRHGFDMASEPWESLHPDGHATWRGVAVDFLKSIR